MALYFDERQIMHGHNGHMWFNNIKIGTLQKVEAKIVGDYTDVNACGDPATYRVYNGYAGEGSFSFLKINSDVMMYIAQEFATGVTQDTKIITTQTTPDGSRAERIAYHNVTFDEVTLAGFEKKAMTESEIPFKFGRFEVLETI